MTACSDRVLPREFIDQIEFKLDPPPIDDWKGVSNQVLLYHRQNKHENNEIKCKDCDEVFRSEVNLKAHRRLNHAYKLINCEKCNYTTKTITQLKKHDRVNHKERIERLKSENTSNIKSIPQKLSQAIFT